MAVLLSPYGGVGAQFLDNSGNVLTGGKIFTYAAGTTTPQVAYGDSTGATPLSNPIILNAAGRVPTGEIWLTDGLVYKFVLTDSNDVLIATYDNIIGINSNFVNFSNQQEIQTATAGQTVFTLTTMAYQPATNSLSVFVDGVNQYGPGAQYAYIETNSTTITFTNGLHVGAEVKFTTSQINSTSAGNASQVTYAAPYAGSVATTVELKLAEVISVSDFGAVGDGVTDDTTAIQNAFDCATALKASVLFQTSGASYLVTSPLSVGANTKVLGNNCEIIYERSDSTDAVQIVLAAAASWSDMTFTIPTGYTIRRFLRCDDNSNLNNIVINSVDQQPLGSSNLDGCLQLRGDNVTVDGLQISNWDRAVFVYQSDNVSLNNYYIQSYVLAINLREITNVRVTNGTIKTKSPNATTSAGHNFILAGGSNITIDTLYGYESGEHGIYCTNDTQLSGLKINNVILDKVGQCGIKVRNFSEVQIDGISIVDCAYDSSTGDNEDGLRLEKVTNANISSYSVQSDIKSNSCNDGIHIDGCQKIYVSAFSVESPKRATIRVQDTYAIANTEIYVNGITSIGCTGNDISVDTTSTTTENIVVGGAMFLGTVGETIYWDTSAASGLLCFGGTVYQNNEDYISNVSNTSGIILNFVGASSIRGQQNRQVFKDIENYALTGSGSTGTVILKSTGTDTLNGYGAGLAFARTGGDRRGAGVAIKRTSNARVNSFGLSFQVQYQDTIANDNVEEKMLLKADGVLQLNSLQTYADNAAALSGGLVAGDFYKTSGGELRIVV